jgi:hypothetical protein
MLLWKNDVYSIILVIFSNSYVIFVYGDFCSSVWLMIIRLSKKLKTFKLIKLGRRNTLDWAQKVKLSRKKSVPKKVESEPKEIQNKPTSPVYSVPPSACHCHHQVGGYTDFLTLTVAKGANPIFTTTLSYIQS